MLPELNAQMQSRDSQVSAFLGIHYGEGHSMGQAEETQNLSTARFPALCTREGRAQEGTWTNATGIYYRGGLLTVAGSKLYFDGTEIGDITPGEKQFATVNSKIVIFPDKVMVDSVDKTITRLEASAEIAAGLAEVVAGAEGSSTGKTGWNPRDAVSLFDICHTKDPAKAKPYQAPSGSRGLYQNGECMTWTDGKVYASTMDSNAYTPESYAAGWTAQE